MHLIWEMMFSVQLVAETVSASSRKIVILDTDQNVKIARPSDCNIKLGPRMIVFCIIYTNCFVVCVTLACHFSLQLIHFLVMRIYF